MSKSTANDIPKRIPLEHIDRIRSSTKNWIKIEVFIKFESKFGNLFEISGEFPTFISSLDSNDERLRGIDIKVGDNIIVINNQNVSRASEKSVRKILKSSNSISMTLFRPDQESLNKLISSDMRNKEQKHKSNIFNFFSSNDINDSFNFNRKSLLSCIGFNLNKQSKINSNNSNLNVINNSKNKIEQVLEKPTIKQDDDLSDCGYYSIPRTEQAVSSKFSSSSDLCSTSSSVTSSTSNLANSISNQNEFKDEINMFMNNIQKAIDHYVRPSIMFKILTIEESLVLYQNIEKLIPVTKFLLNIVNSLDFITNKLPNSESLKIVFDSFKIYLTGLPKAINLLNELTYSNDNFVKFIENLGETCSLKIMNFLFMPLKFVQTTIDILKRLNNSESDEFDKVLVDLYQCVVNTHSILQDKFQSNIENLDNFDSITTVSDCSDFYSLSSEECSIDSIETIPILIKNDSKSDKWFEAHLNADTRSIKIIENHQKLDLNKLQNIKESKNNIVLFIQLIEGDSEQSFYAIKFEHESVKNYVFKRLQNQLLSHN